MKTYQILANFVKKTRYQHEKGYIHNGKKATEESDL